VFKITDVVKPLNTVRNNFLLLSVYSSVLRKRGKLIVRLRAFFSSRPERIRLKRSGIVKERIFGCDLGEHLLNSGHDGNYCRLCQIKYYIL